MPEEITFLEYTEGIARNFINTAVFIDEEAYFPSEEEEHRPERKKLNSPQFGYGSTGHFDLFTPVVSRNDSVEQVEDTTESILDVDDVRSHALNAKTVMDAFAKNGIICSILKPKTCDEITTDYLHSAKKADIVILDWDLFTKDGSLSKEIINNIISTDCNQLKRLRLILIYSAENVPYIFEQITTDEKFVAAHPNLEADDEKFVVTINHCRIVIYTKSWSHLSDLTHSVTIEELPNIIVKEFAQMSAGLLSNVAVHSVATIRNNTHQLLANLKDIYDPAFITHRLLLEIPDASQDFSEEIIISEISSLLESNRVADIANGDAVQKWIKYKKILEPEQYPISILNGKNNTPVEAVISRDVVINIIDSGLPRAVRTGLSAQISTPDGLEALKISEESYGFISTLLCHNDPKKAEHINKKFSSLTTIKRFYKDGNHQPFLTLGTMIKEKTAQGNGKFWLCITPRCDCERVSSDGKEFSFLKLQPRDEGKSADIIVEVKENEFLMFEISYRNHESQLIRFKGEQKSKRVTPKKEGDIYVFKAHTKNGNSVTYEWIGELKRDYVQRIANTYASKISRVGLDEYEWLRRLSRHTD